ncbi:hypothetical protein COMA1_10674 [Candidatus Nitrospira nitrosa]|uniref:Uncharacterized protein n=1 Tax=Candidatus Nitrospira nitrosa TaxID=1742972 RepID=A0A0S4L4H6_9BACT|nr:hypothetical protein COMA1_10674 [Candidatus Nitrospira nitrosa]
MVPWGGTFHRLPSRADGVYNHAADGEGTGELMGNPLSRAQDASLFDRLAVVSSVEGRISTMTEAM